MKRLSIFFIKAFIGPFLATFFISMFMLVMQFLWKYIDDLMGKGLEMTIILELLFYVSASLLPLALPLAILLTALMVMGNIGESNELTALKSGGLSIYRILRPQIGLVFLIALGAFYFSNYIIPIANYKWHSIIWDIQEKKMSSILRPGIYSRQIDGFQIKVAEIEDSHFKNIIIHDRRENNQIKTIKADSGEFYQSENGEYLFFKLYHGDVIEELKESPKFEAKNNEKSLFPSRKSYFTSATYKMDMSGFKLERSKDEMFKDSYEMMNVFQINETVDSIRHQYDELRGSLLRGTKSKHVYFDILSYNNYTKEDENPIEKEETHIIKDSSSEPQKDVVLHEDLNIDTVSFSALPSPIFEIQEMQSETRNRVIDYMSSQLRNNIHNLENQIALKEGRKNNLRRFEIEFHRKFSLPFSIIILFFIGAPLGAIVKRGGFGAPVVIAALLFMIYFVLISIGDEMARSKVVTPFWGMWGPSFVLTPFAILLMVSAANDRSITRLPRINWKKRINKKK